eukprot:jgi/Hompol1/3178/HPOL_006386-RA
MLIVQIGQVASDAVDYHFEMYSVCDLMDIEMRLIDQQETRLIYKINSSPDAFVSGEWLVDADGNINGIRMIAKTSTVDDPVEQIVHFEAATIQAVSSTELMPYGFKVFKPEMSYALPDPIVVGRRVPTAPVRTPRTDFKTRKVSSDSQLTMAAESRFPLACNTVHCEVDRDDFLGVVVVTNNDSKPVTIMSAGAEYRLVGNPKYSNVQDIKFVDTKL